MPPQPPVSVRVPASVPPNRARGDRAEGLVRALQDALRADVDPRAGGHLAVHREAELLEPAELGPRRPVAHEVRVRDEHARRPLVRAEHADGLARLHEQRLVGLEALERAHDRVERLPVAGGLAGAAVDDEVVGALGDLGVEVVHEHAQRRLGLPALGGELGAARGAHGARPRLILSEACPMQQGAAADLGDRALTGDERGRDRLDLGREEAVGTGPAPTVRTSDTTAPVAGAGHERRAQVEAARRRHDLDREHAREPVDRAAQLARRGPAHRDVVLLHRRRRDRVDGCRHGEPLELATRCPRPCTARSSGPSRRRPRARGTAAGPGCGPRSRNRSVRRSLIDATSATAIARKSST